MRHPVSVAALLGFIAFATPCEAQDDSGTSEARAVLRQAVEHLNSGDFAAYAELVTEDMEAFAGVFTPLRFSGKEQWMAFINGLGNVAANYQQHDSDCRSYNDDTVLCNGYFVFVTTADGITDVQSGRESSTLVRVGGQWRIANLHFSSLF